MTTLAQYLVANSLISEEQLGRALDLQIRKGGHIIERLSELGYLDEETLTSHLAERFGFSRVSDNELNNLNGLLEKIPAHLLLKHEILPIRLYKSTLTIATADPFNLTAINEVKFLTGFDVALALARQSAIMKVIKERCGEQSYGGLLSYDKLLSKVSEDSINIVGEEEAISIQSLERLTTEPPIVSLANALLVDAIKKSASDIHVEPQRKFLRVRFRIDGMLHEVVQPPLAVKDGLISRLKVLANLDIAERRVPQDGRVRINVLGREVDMRVSTLPTPFGESVVIRLLDRHNLLLDLDLIGFSPSTLLPYKALISQPHGMVLVTGPTGSGKTTTLYASLNEINSMEKSIVTIEDPVEYELPGITQVQVKPQSGLTFARGLRAALRQDPDIIMVGEIRDAETAEIAVQAALTGHLVLSTLHTNDAAGAVSRLTEMGIKGHLLRSSLLGVVAQRLVRRLCKGCGGRGQNGSDAKIPAKSPVGCERCSHTGYRGRIGIYELLKINNEIRSLNLEQVDSRTIKDTAIKSGMLSLSGDGVEKVQAGLTTMAEVVRVSAEDE